MNQYTVKVGDDFRSATTEDFCTSDLKAHTHEAMIQMSQILSRAVTDVAQVPISIQWMNILDKVNNPEGYLGFFHIVRSEK